LQEHSDPPTQVMFSLCLVTLIFDLLSFSDHKINRFPGLIVEHVYVKFGDPIAASSIQPEHYVLPMMS